MISFKLFPVPGGEENAELVGQRHIRQTGRPVGRDLPQWARIAYWEDIAARIEPVPLVPGAQHGDYGPCTSGDSSAGVRESRLLFDQPSEPEATGLVVDIAAHKSADPHAGVYDIHA